MTFQADPDAVFTNGRATVYVAGDVAVLPNGKRAPADDYEDWAELEPGETAYARATAEQVEAINALMNPAACTGFKEAPKPVQVLGLVKRAGKVVGVRLATRGSVSQHEVDLAARRVLGNRVARRPGR